VKSAYKGYEVVDVDGVRVATKGGWFLVRPSGTEPVLRIMLEARSEDEGKRMLEELLSIVRGAVG